MDRRAFLIAAAAGVMASRAVALPAGESLPLWPSAPPGGGGPTGPLSISSGGAVSNVAVPTLGVVAPERPNGAAVLVAAGGGYRRIGNGRESDPAALWLARQGVTAFVLTYRLPGEGWAVGPLAPLQDAQRAIRLIRAQAARRGLDTKRIGGLGFSAGGHLIGLSATRSDFHSYTAVDAVDDASARLDFAALIYPIVSLGEVSAHTSSRRQLIGRDPSRAASDEWSVETHVRAGDPPLFLVNTGDDPIADPANCQVLAEACRRAGVPVELHTFATGGHGFGMGRPGTPTVTWPGLCRDWLSGLHVLS